MHTLHLGLTISFASKWHCGSGEGSLITNRLISRDSRNCPFIPGSTLKGVIREQCEKLSRTLGFPSPPDIHSKSLTDPGKFIPLKSVPSPVDEIFGNNFEEGGLFFRDARLAPEAAQILRGHDSWAQTRTQRHRFLGTVKEGHLFSTEYALEAWEPDNALKFTTIIDGYHRHLKTYENYLPYAYYLLVLGIMSVERLGGDKSTGAGEVKIEIAFPFKYNGGDLRVENLLKLMDLDYHGFGVLEYNEMIAKPAERERS